MLQICNFSLSSFHWSAWFCYFDGVFVFKYSSHSGPGLFKFCPPAIPDGKTWSIKVGRTWRTRRAGKGRKTSTSWLKTFYLRFITLYLWLKKLYLSTRWLKTLYFTVFMVTSKRAWRTWPWVSWRLEKIKRKVEPCSLGNLFWWSFHREMAVCLIWIIHRSAAGPCG